MKVGSEAVRAVLQPGASQEVTGADAQAAAKAHQASNRQVVLPPFDATQIAAVDPGLVGQALLRETYLRAHSTYRLANRNQDGITSGMRGGSSHAPCWRVVELDTTGYDLHLVGFKLCRFNNKKLNHMASN